MVAGSIPVRRSKNQASECFGGFFCAFGRIPCDGGTACLERSTVEQARRFELHRGFRLDYVKGFEDSGLPDEGEHSEEENHAENRAEV